MDFPTIITVTAGIATIIGLVFTIVNWKQSKKQESVTNNTVIIQQNSIVTDLSTTESFINSCKSTEITTNAIIILYFFILHLL